MGLPREENGKGGLWSITDMLDQIRVFSDRVMSNW